MSVPNFRKSYHMGFEKNCRKSRLSKQFDKTGNSGKSIQPKIDAIGCVEFVLIQGIQWYLNFADLKNCRKSRLSKQFDKTGNSGKSIQPKIDAIGCVEFVLIQGIQWYLNF